MGQGLLRRHPHRHAHRHHRHVVLHLRAPRLRGLLLRVQGAPPGPPRAHQRHPAADPHAGVVHGPAVHHARRRDPALRRRLHRALLHHDLHLAAALLLRVRLPHDRAAHPGDHLLGDLHRALLLPALQRGLRLVVAEPAQLGRSGHLPLRVQLRLLQHAARGGRRGTHHGLLCVHGGGLALLLPHHRYRRLLRRLHLRLADLRRRQGGLTGHAWERPRRIDRSRAAERSQRTDGLTVGAMGEADWPGPCAAPARADSMRASSRN
mmetsp:Transcript_17590/g.51110  ORF Transcript_17590/g.51110 Transcript_17590/m.51110 type:complete len:264 (-) Transcript_17590:121-912(-)